MDLLAGFSFFASHAPSDGTQWLEIASASGWGNTVQASSLVLTTWNYKTSVAVYPTD